LPDTILGMIEASTIRPFTLSSGSTTASSSVTMRQVPIGWNIVVAMSLAFAASSSSVSDSRL
jgi:hypothetical protein